jgi:hypothetical protein
VICHLYKFQENIISLIFHKIFKCLKYCFETLKTLNIVKMSSLKTYIRFLLINAGKPYRATYNEIKHSSWLCLRYLLTYWMQVADYVLIYKGEIMRYLVAYTFILVCFVFTFIHSFVENSYKPPLNLRYLFASW